MEKRREGDESKIGSGPPPEMDTNGDIFKCVFVCVCVCVCGD